MVDIPPRLKTVRHLPREILRHIFFLLEEENEKVDGYGSSRRVRNPTKINI